MADSISTLTDQNWNKDVLQSSQPVLVDFWAEWCVPCKSLLPAIEAVAEQFAGKLRVGKMNIEENELVPQQYDVNMLPTLMVFKDGKVADQRKGMISRDALVKLVQSHL
jgi:thioredoxin 1